jgi:hypothetical protein
MKDNDKLKCGFFNYVFENPKKDLECRLIRGGSGNTYAIYCPSCKSILSFSDR